MSTSWYDFKKLTDAEDYFKFFNLSYDPKVVNINRLHILKKFSQLVEEIDANFTGEDREKKFDLYKAALEQSYQVFLNSTSLDQKLFKVFNQKPNNVVLLAEINAD